MISLASIDHIVMLSPSAKIASDFIRNKLGLAPAFGGRHVAFGTCNYLLSLGESQYLEVIAPQKELEAIANIDDGDEFLSACRALAQPMPYTFCIATSDFANLESILKANGIAVAGPISEQRQRPDGELLKWELLTCFDSEYGSVFPFFIKWGDCEHPATTSPTGCSLKNLVVRHPQHERLSAVFGALNLQVSVHNSKRPGLDVVLSSPNGLVEL